MSTTWHTHMDDMQSYSIGNVEQPSPIEIILRNWLKKWRTVNSECLCVKTTAYRLQNLVVLATEQMQCYETILKDRKLLNDRFIECITAAKKIVSNQTVKHFKLNNEHKELILKLNYLEDELAKTADTLRITQLQLQRIRHKLRQQTIKTNKLDMELKESTMLNIKLKEYNRRLKEKTVESLEVYSSRALMFITKLVDMAQELVTTKAKTKAYADTCAYLKKINSNLEQRQRIQLREISNRSSFNNQIIRNLFNFQFKCVLKIWHYMRISWDCVASLAQCPRFASPYCNFEWALVFI